MTVLQGVHYFTPAAIPALWREGCGGHLSEDSGFPFWITAHAGTDIYDILTSIHILTYALTLARLHTGE